MLLLLRRLHPRSPFLTILHQLDIRKRIFHIVCSPLPGLPLAFSLCSIPVPHRRQGMPRFLFLCVSRRAGERQPVPQRTCRLRSSPLHSPKAPHQVPSPCLTLTQLLLRRCRWLLGGRLFHCTYRNS